MFVCEGMKIIKQKNIYCSRYGIEVSSRCEYRFWAVDKNGNLIFRGGKTPASGYDEVTYNGHKYRVEWSFSHGTCGGRRFSYTYRDLKVYKDGQLIYHVGRKLSSACHWQYFAKKESPLVNVRQFDFIKHPRCGRVSYIKIYIKTSQPKPPAKAPKKPQPQKPSSPQKTITVELNSKNTEATLKLSPGTKISEMYIDANFTNKCGYLTCIPLIINGKNYYLGCWCGSPGTVFNSGRYKSKVVRLDASGTGKCINVTDVLNKSNTLTFRLTHGCNYVSNIKITLKYTGSIAHTKPVPSPVVKPSAQLILPKITYQNEPITATVKLTSSIPVTVDIGIYHNNKLLVKKTLRSPTTAKIQLPPFRTTGSKTLCLKILKIH